MTPDFVPFQVSPAGANGSKAQSRAIIVPGANSTPAFIPLSEPATPASTQPTSHSEPQVVLEREGDHIKRIKVHCPCGNVIELACEY